jgi:hypothetical protein
MDAGDPAGIAALRGQRHEAGLGLRLAVADGGRDICHHPDRFRPWPSAAIWPRVERDGSGDRRDGGDRGDRPDRGQGALFTVGAFPASALGDRAEVGGGVTSSEKFAVITHEQITDALRHRETIAVAGQKPGKRTGFVLVAGVQFGTNHL